MRALFLAVFFCSISFYSYSQCDSTQWAQEGTYELIKVNGSIEINNQYPKTPLTNDQLCLIESLRSNNQFVYHQLDAYTRVKIYPRIKKVKVGIE